MGTNISPDWYQILSENVADLEAAVIFVLGPEGIITVQGEGLTTLNAPAFAEALEQYAEELKSVGD